MNNQTVNNKDEIEIDLLHLIKILWSKGWIVVASMLLAGAIAFSYALLFITPLYTSSAMMYVNNSSFEVGASSFSISTGELSAAKSLLDTYVVIMKARTTLEEVIEEADLEYTYRELSGMITAASVNDTEVFQITATSPDPAEAELIVDTIVEILPDRISEIVDGSSVRIVDTAILPTARSSPSYTKYAIVGMILGFALSCGVIVVLDLMNNTIRDEDHIAEKYNLPLLAVVPDMRVKKNSSYGYYSYGKSEQEEK